jgi:phage terminase large subunit
MSQVAPIRVEIPAKIMRVFANPDGSWRRSFKKSLRGGRGSAKSESVARILIAKARSRRGRALCTRQYQNSIEDSVHRTLVEAANSMGVLNEFEVQKRSIVHVRTGYDFVFKGIQRSIGEIKSMKGITDCWVEEAEGVPLESWQILEPTLREEDAELIATWNPDQEMSATYQRFVAHPDRDTISIEVNWRDNPFFPAILNRQRLVCLETDQDAYDWIWEGKCRKITEAIIFRNRMVIEGFDEPAGIRPLYGLDFGFANDPTAGVRFYVHDDCLFITHEAGGIGIEIDQTKDLLTGKLLMDGLGNMQGLPGVEDWPIKADGSRPETISYLHRQGLNISAAEKWPGSVEDGVAHMKGFRRIVVHPRCRQVAQEFRLYSYKVDKKQLDANGNPSILPEIVDKWNHYIDAIRYGLDGYIQSRGEGGVWARLAG